MKQPHEEKSLVELAEKMVEYIFDASWFQDVVDRLAKQDSGTADWTTTDWERNEDTYQYKLYHALHSEYTMIVLTKACTKLHVYGHTDVK